MVSSRRSEEGPKRGLASLLLSPSIKQAVGTPLAFERRPSALRDLFVEHRREALPDQWAILGSFKDNRRGRDGWIAASGLALDLDWENPTLPPDEGAHHAIPDEGRAAILRALESYPIPGLAYLTPRGVRAAHVLAEDVSDLHAYEELVDGAAERILEHLAAEGIPLWRDGVTGLRLDATSRRPWQAMRVPLSDQPIVPTGRDCEVYGTALRVGVAEQMDLDAALPPEIADACRRIAAWAQIAVEVVVTGLMAITSAAIGNTRWIEARGRAHPVSLHYLTSVPSGSGKGTVRTYLRKAAERIEAEVLQRRKAATRELEDFQERLAIWKSDGRSQKARPTRGPRPEPPSLIGAGGERTSFIVSEASLEGVVATLEDTPRGFLWASDEAHEVVGMLGRYGDGGGARSLDAARMRRLMDSAPVEAHRARSNKSAVRHLPRPWLAIDADVQPKVMRELFTGEDQVSGLTARFLIHEPPALQGTRQYVEPPEEPSPAVLSLLQARLEALWAHEQRLNGESAPVYTPLSLDADAERAWALELERLERRYPQASDEESGFLGHARGRLLRLAGVLTLLANPEAASVELVDVRRAIAHLRYHLAQRRAMASDGDEEAETGRLETLRDQVQRIYDSQPQKGVRPTDLRRHVSKRRYGGQRGLERAYADLHALGWQLKRPKGSKGKPGRPPVPAFFPGRADLQHQHPPGPSSPKPHKPPNSGLGGLGDSPRGGNAHAGPPADDLLERASERLLSRGEVELPAPGRRVHCPACGSPDGLGIIPETPTRWYCHSDRHSGHRAGCAVDLSLASRLERMPTPIEAVTEAKSILGTGIADRPHGGARPDSSGVGDEDTAAAAEGWGEL